MDSRVVSKMEWRLGRTLGSFIRKGHQRFTVMLIPHSERRTFNFQLSVFTLLFLGTLLVVLIFAFLFVATHFTTTNERMAAVTRLLAASEQEIEMVSDEIIALQGAMQEFQGSLQQLLRVLSSESVIASATAAGDGDLDAFVSRYQVAAAEAPGVTALRQIGAELDSAMTPLAELNDTVAVQLELLVDIPTLWPIRGGGGWVTFEFGLQRHPFTNTFYIHRGIDIAMRSGAEVVATANGTVQRVGFERYNLGNVVEIQHKFGFVTRYGHLSSVLVEAGQAVQRGQLIGLIGSTGLSTGPHVHYEIGIGEQIIDPNEFLSISAIAAAVASR